MGEALSLAIVFLVNIIFELIAMAMVLRILLHWFKANPNNNFYQLIDKITTPVIQPLRSMLSSSVSLDMALILVLLMVVFLKLLLVLLIKGVIFSLGGLVTLMFADLCHQLLNIFFFSVLLLIIVSWLQPKTYNPLIEILYLLTNPLLRLARQMIPPIVGWDLSPFLVLIGIKFVDILVIGSLYSLAN